MIRLKQAVIVEGKYDKITLENLIDATILPVNGFGIFKDTEKRELIRTLARRDGIIVMTDSDSAGQLIRAHIKNICADGKVINVYVPQLNGKERRKKVGGKEGILGVEGLSPDILLKVLEQSGVTSQTDNSQGRRITKTDLFKWGLSGGENSSQKREDIAEFLSIPRKFSPNAFLDVINTLFTAEEFERKVQLWQQETDKK